jgi:hypothetical protein
MIKLMLCRLGFHKVIREAVMILSWTESQGHLPDRPGWFWTCACGRVLRMRGEPPLDEWIALNWRTEIR